MTAVIGYIVRDCPASRKVQKRIVGFKSAAILDIVDTISALIREQLVFSMHVAAEPVMPGQTAICTLWFAARLACCSRLQDDGRECNGSPRGRHHVQAAIQYVDC